MLLEGKLFKAQIADGLTHARHLLRAENHQREGRNGKLCPTDDIAEGAVFQRAEETPLDCCAIEQGCSIHTAVGLDKNEQYSLLPCDHYQ